MDFFVNPIHNAWQQVSKYTGLDQVVETVDQAFENVADTLEDGFNQTFGLTPDDEFKQANPELFTAENTLNASTRVLIIGDSQTVGPYGQRLDEMARLTGAKVETRASWGSSPHWWMTGQKTNYKYWSHDEDGVEINAKNQNTPLLKELLAEEKPDIVIVTMGGNMMGTATQANVSSQVAKIGNAVTASGAKLFWVGPPKYDENKRSKAELETFYQYLENAVEPHGELVDSRPYISKYSGNDGLHYTGRTGEKRAEKWAEGVFGEIQTHPD